MAVPATYCSVCGKFHTGERYVRQSGLTDVRQESLTKQKKSWIKPEIRRYVRVPSLTGDPFVKIEDVVKQKEFDKKAYQREWMRKKREMERANRVG